LNKVRTDDTLCIVISGEEMAKKRYYKGRSWAIKKDTKCIYLSI
jgi:hypothetical protein